MRNIKIIADSSSDMLSFSPLPFESVPLKIITDSKEFVDDKSLDVSYMIEYFDKYKGTSKSSCPNAAEYLEAFGDADEIFCITITSALSGSYNAAYAAKQTYESEHEGRRVCIIDSLSTGPEIRLIVEKLSELIAQGLDFDSVCQSISDYQKQTGLVFILESMKNLANNGRVSPMAAKLAGILGICVIGRASNEGTLEPLGKCRGTRRAIDTVVEHLKNAGLWHGKVRIGHCANPETAIMIKNLILDTFDTANVDIYECRGLCSFYAEKGGILVGFEKF